MLNGISGRTVLGQSCYVVFPRFHITGCPGQPFLPVGQPKVDPWLPHRTTKNFAICLYNYVVGQLKSLVGQPLFYTGCPTGQPAFKTQGVT